MTRDDKQRWVDALRSGEYTQNRGNLCTEGEDGPRFCVLGVYADVNMDAYWVEHPAVDPGEWAILHRTETYALALPHSTVPGDLQQELTQLNDQGMSFADLARKIEYTIT